MTLDRDDMTALVVLIGLAGMAAGIYLQWGVPLLLVFLGFVLVYAGRRDV